MKLGVACVQLLLSYSLRGRLQAALLLERDGGLNPAARSAAAALEPQILRLLLELDAPDDATRGRRGDRTRYSCSELANSSGFPA